MARGRKPDRPEVQDAKGNPGKRAKRQTAAADVPESKGAAPASLNAAGKKVWSKLQADLGATGILRATDEQVLARYCDTVVRYWAITAKLRRRGEVYDAPMTNGGKMRRLDPLFAVQERLAKRLEGMEDRLGLNPRSRYEIIARLSNAGPPQHPGELPLGNAGESTPAPRSPIGILN